jgi:lactoylglutathione lyase
MNYLHSMLRVQDLDSALRFFCDLLDFEEVERKESEKGRFTLVFLAAPGDIDRVQKAKTPTIELTYNWPDAEGNTETYNGGRNFGHLAYRVQDIYALCEKLQANGITINRPPRDGHMAFIRTPDGISIELLQAGAPQAPAEPWASMENSGYW